MAQHYILYYLFSEDQRRHPLSPECSDQIRKQLLCPKAKPPPETPEHSEKTDEVKRNEKF